METGEEPDCIALWELTHTKNGTWSNTESQEVYVSTLIDSVILVHLLMVNIDAIAIIVLFVLRTKHVKRCRTKKLKLKVHSQVSRETMFSRLHTKTPCNASHHSLVGTDTWPNLKLVLKGLGCRLRSKLVLQQKPSSKTMSSTSM
jgi:hypothetical protein